MKLNWNFQRGAYRGAEGPRQKSLPRGRYGYFLELYIIAKK